MNLSIPSMTIDSTKCPTDLCLYGQHYYADKSPFNKGGHRHPYTAVYSLLMAQYRYRPVRFSEIGVAYGSSVKMWNTYFQKGTFFFFDRDQNFLDHSAQGLGSNNSFAIMDVAVRESISNSLKETGGNLDILLDDSSHNISHQHLIINEALPFIRSGGMIIIEDIHRDEPEETYFNMIKDILDEFSFVSFIVTDHENRYSPGWNNDKLLVLIKK